MGEADVPRLSVSYLAGAWRACWTAALASRDILFAKPLLARNEAQNDGERQDLKQSVEKYQSAKRISQEACIPRRARGKVLEFMQCRFPLQ
jgi:hypothetical protein